MNETGFETYYIKGKYKKCHLKREITKGELHFYKLNNCQRKKLEITKICFSFPNSSFHCNVHCNCITLRIHSKTIWGRMWQECYPLQWMETRTCSVFRMFFFTKSVGRRLCNGKQHCVVVVFVYLCLLFVYLCLFYPEVCARHTYLLLYLCQSFQTILHELNTELTFLWKFERFKLLQIVQGNILLQKEIPLIGENVIHKSNTQVLLENYTCCTCWRRAEN